MGYLIITHKLLDQFASNFDLGTGENHRNVLGWVGWFLWEEFNLQAKQGSQASLFRDEEEISDK